ncbi:hypothetical protein MAPG_05215 [Magnaporthiopsis poae ATCC 64411]|uniref:Large ribosomal subunit protein uL23m n=1 Tax=Magnaporthiopsis poae (strain ATCC 64411 / 73-15) TaxID=644358 RepID=A0A0C4DYT6_MAGP6|nr:hypothetical protein MAPG_05215 [Magnaporthiopsis poae ATCC 64411]
MSTALSKVATTLPRFAVGKQQIFLPNHVITFISPKPLQPPNLAAFIVPLKFNKLDLRDYLWHAYGVEVRSVRSFISGKPLSKHYESGDGQDPIRHQTRRPKSEKKMLAELKVPFVFPSVPEDLSPWDNDIFKAVTEVSEGNSEDIKNLRVNRRRANVADRPVSNSRISLAKQAEALRLRKEAWSNDSELDDKWVEVEKDIQLPPSK